MPTTTGYVPVQIRPALAKKLEKRRVEAAKKFPDTPEKFGTYVNDLLTDVLDKDDFLQKFAPMLSLDGYNNNMLFIRDETKKARVEIYRHDNKIKCAFDDSFDCEHVHFALAIPEIAKMLRR